MSYEILKNIVYQRNELDDQGNPYPVLYMRLEKEIKKYKYNLGGNNE